MIKKKGFVYILTNVQNNVFYTGVTSNLKRRIWEHKNSAIEGFTAKYKTNKLVYFETFNEIEDAIAREKYIKGKKREFKKRLIIKNNPYYLDLYYTNLK